MKMLSVTTPVVCLLAFSTPAVDRGQYHNVLRIRMLAQSCDGAVMEASQCIGSDGAGRAYFWNGARHLKVSEDHSAARHCEEGAQGAVLKVKGVKT
jgi:hypothetical protein